ncbi:conserved hypothetical protein [Nostocoides japonicum T1-X7]|uniref:Antitoxin FitA-like ribbon-helix-helix domain-containing protein n=1 Tax=Nostocoides japonicum T1-X7 TaxID=1194083 RepID=A0A077M828_9MICO|nr:conserved hypothetical protein [Tetrasphaera japonica T1-X7]
MAQVLIRGLDEGVKRRLQERARRRGVSMEAEARDTRNTEDFSDAGLESLTNPFEGS